MRIRRFSFVTSRMPVVRRLLPVPLLKRQQAFGYSEEDIKFLMSPMAQTGQEATGAMGTDTPLSALSSRSKHAGIVFQAALRPGHEPAD